MDVSTEVDVVAEYVSNTLGNNFDKIHGGHREIFIPKADTGKVLKFLKATGSRQIKIDELQKLHDLADQEFNLVYNSNLKIRYIKPEIQIVEIDQQEYILYIEEFLLDVYGFGSENFITQNLCSLGDLFPDKNHLGLTSRCKELLDLSFNSGNVEDIAQYLADNDFHSMRLTINQIRSVPQFKETVKLFITAYESFLRDTNIFLDTQGCNNIVLHINKLTQEIIFLVNNSSVKHYLDIDRFFTRMSQNDFIGSSLLFTAITWTNLLAISCDLDPVFSLETNLAKYAKIVQHLLQ